MYRYIRLTSINVGDLHGAYIMGRSAKGKGGRNELIHNFTKAYELRPDRGLPASRALACSAGLAVLVV